MVRRLFALFVLTVAWPASAAPAVTGGSPLTGALAVTALSAGSYGLSRTLLKNKSISGN